MRELQDAIDSARKAHRRKPTDHATLLHAINLLERVHGKNKPSSYNEIIDAHDPKRKGK
jgi:hypothetical protein